MIHRPIKPVASPDTRKTRVDMRRPVRVMAHPLGTGVAPCSGWVITLGVGGMMIDSGARLPLETRCTFELTLKGERDTLLLDGWIVSDGVQGMGVQFDILSRDHIEQVTRMMNACGQFTPPQRNSDR